jgi:hypothetical protein
MSRELKSWRKGEGIFAAGWGATDADSGWVMLELVGPGSGQLTAQHKRARDVAGESSCPTAALQQSIMPMSMLECIWIPAETLPHSAATRTRDVNHFNIARAACTYLINSSRDDCTLSRNAHAEPICQLSTDQSEEIVRTFAVNAKNCAKA